MNFIRNNQECIAVSLIVCAMLISAAFIGASFRGGEPWAYAHIFQAGR